MRLRKLTAVAPFLPLVFGFVLGDIVLRTRTVSVTFNRDGRAFRADDGRWRPIPAMLTLHDASWVRLRVVNRDTSHHAVGVLSVEPGDSVEVRPDVCATTWRGADLLVLVR